MHNLLSYEKEQLKEIEKWKTEEPGVISQAFGLVLELIRTPNNYQQIFGHSEKEIYNEWVIFLKQNYQTHQSLTGQIAGW